MTTPTLSLLFFHSPQDCSEASQVKLSTEVAQLLGLTASAVKLTCRLGGSNTARRRGLRQIQMCDGETVAVSLQLDLGTDTVSKAAAGVSGVVSDFSSKLGAGMGTSCFGGHNTATRLAVSQPQTASMSNAAQCQSLLSNIAVNSADITDLNCSTALSDGSLPGSGGNDSDSDGGLSKNATIAVAVACSVGGVLIAGIALFAVVKARANAHKRLVEVRLP